MTNRPRHAARILTFLFALSSLPALAEPITLKRAVELALQHATGLAMAIADEQHADAGYREMRDSFIPQVTAGAGLGWSYGFPLSLEGAAPSLFNFNAQSPLWHFELRDFLGAARAETAAATLKKKDARDQVIQDTALSYAELQKWEQRLVRLHQAEADAQQFESAVGDRVKEGVDSELEGTKAKLSAARVHLRIAEAEGAADVLREHLSKLTGLPAAGLQTEDSLPSLPDTQQPEETSEVADANPAVRSAVEHARAQYLIAKGDRKSWLPSVDFGAQYAVLSKFNNYQTYFQPGSFVRNNATVGGVIRFPFLSLPKRDHAQGAEADAMKARKQAEAAKNQVTEQTLRLQRSITQLQAAHDVAELEFEIAQKDVESVQTRMQASGANLHDLDDARTQATEKFITLQDMNFELERSQIQLLRATGGLERWAEGAK
ncbi:MAG TPA: TolC family protein [Candidatus Binatia bacterium]|nr:TolC family protein [Candidatus Binatia bacterium]